MSLSPAEIAHMEHILQCPVTGQRVHWLSSAEIEQLRQEIASPGLSHYSQEPVERAPAAGFITDDETIVYPVENGIVFMLPEVAILRNREADKPMPGYSKTVRTYYETFGWEKDVAGNFMDTSQHVDLRPVVQDYQHRCLMRVMDYLPAKGDYLLDVACGPLAFPEHKRYAENYDIRICVDIALPALLSAQDKVPNGLFILGDIVNLPLRSAVAAAALSLHTVYHVPAENQHQAFEELFRVLSDGGCAVVVYIWGNASLLMNVTVKPVQRVRQWLKRSRQKPPAADSPPPLYAYAHPWRWFREQSWNFDLEIHCWKSLNQDFTRYFIHPFLFGKQLLRMVFWLERKFPKAMGRIGQYPLIIISK